MQTHPNTANGAAMGAGIHTLQPFGRKTACMIPLSSTALFGWFAAPALARLLLSLRGMGAQQGGGIFSDISLIEHAACALITLAAVRATGDKGIACQMLSALAAAAVSCAACCDCRARIIPWESCVLLLGAGMALQLMQGASAGLIASLCGAVVITALLMASRALAAFLRHPCPIGMGDVRLVPGLIVFSGYAGSVLGAMACSLLMGVWGLLTFIKRARRERTDAEGALAPTQKHAGAGNPSDTLHSTVPMGPGFALWFCVACAVMQ